MLRRQLVAIGRQTAAASTFIRGQCTLAAGDVADLLAKTPSGQSIVWVAPCASTFKAETAKALGSDVVFHDQLDASELFTSSTAPNQATALVVSAQTVSKQFLKAWRDTYPQSSQTLTLVRRGTSLGSIDLDAAKELGIAVVSTPGVNSPHVAAFAVDTLGLSAPMATDAEDVSAVVVGSGSVGQCVIQLMKDVGVTPTVVNRSAESPSLTTALRGATHVAVCAATSSSEPIIQTAHIEALLAGAERAIDICSVSRPEAFSLDAIMMVADHARAHLRFDYGDSILAPAREKVNQGGVRENVTWSSEAMASEACKRDLDRAVLLALSGLGA